MLDYDYKNDEDGRNEKKRGLGDLYGKLLQLHLHYICIKRKPHGLTARAWGKSVPGPAHGLGPTAQQLRPLMLDNELQLCKALRCTFLRTRIHKPLANERAIRF